MPEGVNIDGVLATWGDRLFYPGNRVVKGGPPPKLTGSALRQRANFIRNRIEAVVRRAPQVMVKVTGGGRSMRAIAAHLRYISKNGRLRIEDDRGEVLEGPRAVRDLADEWRYGGSLIPSNIDTVGRREAFNVMLSMPRGTDPLAVQRAAREFARIELAGHKYVMVLHDHQANPHVHLSVRAEGLNGRRLNPRRADLHRWREVFARELRELGVDAEATARSVRWKSFDPQPLWQLKKMRNTEGRELARPQRPMEKGVMKVWQSIHRALVASANSEDRNLGDAISNYLSRASIQPPDRENHQQKPLLHRRSRQR